MPDPRTPILYNSPVDEERTYITGPDGTPRLVGTVREHTETTPEGERRYIKTVLHVTAADGHVIDPKHPQVFDCPHCGQAFISIHGIRWCNICQTITCLQRCAHPIMLEDGQQAYLCPGCHQRTQRANFIQYLFSLP